ncbi:hypothetical protein SAMN05192583_1579 [Sphingomonas gellani]|uniref:Uncharacterized protein n=1 Tax=Sphingomonas gellani TaxID=1166340 RepID=A0A1H8CHI8_9SPHN|nr:hypothetical protein [Sphingomonas gellani]SEM93547.1 hypothetical protein SAMN05192583_1579 [Sphingomonas gellani]
MYNHALERELEAHERYHTAPLCWWRTLAAEQFAQNADVVEAAVASIAAVSRLAPDHLIGELTTSLEEERARTWNELAAFYMRLDGMQLGLCAEIAGSAAALSANLMDPLGLVTLLNLLAAIPDDEPSRAARDRRDVAWRARRASEPHNDGRSRMAPPPPSSRVGRG